MSEDRVPYDVDADAPITVVDDRHFQFWYTTHDVHEQVRQLGGYVAVAVYQEFCYLATAWPAQVLDPCQVAARMGLDYSRFERVVQQLQAAGLVAMLPDPDQPGATLYLAPDPEAADAAA